MTWGPARIILAPCVKPLPAHRTGGIGLCPLVSTGSRGTSGALLPLTSPTWPAMRMNDHSHLSFGIFFCLKLVHMDIHVSFSLKCQLFLQIYEKTAPKRRMSVITKSLIKAKNEENVVFSQKTHLPLATHIFSLKISAIFFRGFNP